MLGTLRHILGTLRHILGTLRQMLGFVRKSRVFAFFTSKTSEISNFITLPILSESSP
jgi:hypothetical protein